MSDAAVTIRVENVRHEQVPFFCSCVNLATEGDLNMHSSKGFYTTILVTDESHPVTALQPVVVSVCTLHRVCLNPETSTD